MNKFLKYFLLLISVIFQLGAIISIFIQPSKVVLFACIYLLALVLLLVVFIVERRKEKKEEDDYVNRDY
ncbi:hypothetical protein [Bacillus sp. FJAT-45350]|uniref:hypothetical protein n=1 Tax=Bacillus sp. FJAT-45350 TaxID=2011014 RepID=UPI000BB69562|nr:hypothetical protein [Bacillus sp. FJAT-45350]